MKVKIFSLCGKLFGKSKKSTDLEEEINVWMESQHGIKVVDIKQTSSGGSLEPAEHLISIWYETVD